MLSNPFKKSARFWLIVTGLLLLFSAHTASAETSTMKRSTLLEQPVNLPSQHINGKVIRVTFPGGFQTPPHTHEGPGPRYVVKGKLEVTEGKQTGIYSAGDVFWESGQSMTVKNLGSEPAEVIIFELVPASAHE